MAVGQPFGSRRFGPFRYRFEALPVEWHVGSRSLHPMLNCLRARLLDNGHAPLTPFGTLPADATLMTGGLEWFRESFASEALRGKGLLFIRLWPG